ncbi:YopX family protein [Helicobacter rodentium]|uniref:YopX family protein n=1 Tax=Helicobacter rodentium TaxID=59617 RepID=UPI0023F0FE73|nr:YopX family protein [Helicobacter rodentium]
MRLQDLDFRVWDNKRKKYIEDYIGIFKLFVFDKNISDMKRTIELHELPNGFEEKFNPIDDGELEFYTGFKDENGDKIYEGDIVDTGDFRDVVKFEKSKGWILQETLDSLDDYQDWQLEVIGNIHENKNLLDDSIEQSNTNNIKRMR